MRLLEVIIILTSHVPLSLSSSCVLSKLVARLVGHSSHSTGRDGDRWCVYVCVRACVCVCVCVLCVYLLMSRTLPHSIIG